MSRYIVLCLISLSFISCSSVQKSHLNSGVDITIDSPMRAKIDVDMSRKLVGYASGGFLFHLMHVNGDNKYAEGINYNGEGKGWLSFLSKVEKVKSAAAYNAIRTSDAEVLVSPQYVIEESHWNPLYKSVKVKVTGYPGKIVTIKNRP